MAFKPKQKSFLRARFAGVEVEPERVPKHVTLLKPIRCAGYWEYCPLERHTDNGVERLAPVLQTTADGAREGVVERVYHHFAYRDFQDLLPNDLPINTRCSCAPGPHLRAIYPESFHVVAANIGRPVAEVAHYGGRGSGKSEDALFIIIRGNAKARALPANTDPGSPEFLAAAADVSYVNHRNYRFLVLRRNSTDLSDFFRRAKEFFSKIDSRIEFTESPMRIKFPSGAEGVLDHLADANAWMKYQGQEYQTVIIEEAGQIPDEESFERILASCRSSFPELAWKVYLTFNPGGPGTAWLKKRYIKLQMRDGAAVPHGVPIWNPSRERYQMVVHSTVYDNPYFMRTSFKGGGYLGVLKGISRKALRKQWLLGDIDAFEGQVFEEYRDTHVSGEPDRACHVYTPEQIPMMPWWPRILGMDIGHTHWTALFKACVTPSGQLVVYDEMVESHVTAVEWGNRLARWVVKELAGLDANANGSATIPLFLSPDAFAHRGAVMAGEERSLAEQVEYGIKMILGQDATRSLTASETGEEDFLRRASFQSERARIVLRRANDQRIAGWDWMHEMLRWRRLERPKAKHFDQAYAKKLLDEDGVTKYAEYVNAFRKQDDNNPLPRLIVTSNCTKLREAIPAAEYDADGRNPKDVKKTNTIQDDCNDSVRYLCMGYKRILEKEPLWLAVEQRLTAARLRNPNITGENLERVADRAASEWEQEGAPEAFMIGSGPPSLQGAIQ